MSTGGVTAAWRPALSAWAVATIAIVFLCLDTLTDMIEIWSRSATFTHCYLVLPIVIWLVWNKRVNLLSVVPRPEPWIYPLAVCVLFTWLMGNFAAVNAVSQFSAVALIAISVPAILGLEVAKLLAFPLAFLFFSVPFGEFLLPQLMNWTADFTVRALQLSGIPVYREGLQFVIPSGNWSVVEACSGVRYLIASATVGSLFAYLTYRSTKRRLVFICAAIAVPILANWLRAYLIVLLGHLSSNKLAAGVDHLIYGWVFFGIVIMLMFSMGSRWAEVEKPGEAISGIRDETGHAQGVGIATYAVASGLMVFMMAIAALLLAQMGGSGTHAEVAMPSPDRLGNGWQRQSESLNFRPAIQRPSASLQTEYARRGRSVGLYLGYFREQNKESKLVSSTNVLVASNDPVWAQTQSGSRHIEINGVSKSIHTAELGKGRLAMRNAEGRLLVWKIYWIGGILTANDYAAKVYSAWNRLLGKGDDSAVIILFTPVTGNANTDESELLEQFLVEGYAELDGMLRRAVKGARH